MASMGSVKLESVNTPSSSLDIFEPDTAVSVRVVLRSPWWALQRDGGRWGLGLRECGLLHAAPNRNKPQPLVTKKVPRLLVGALSAGDANLGDGAH